jgi:hypothetical protein
MEPVITTLKYLAPWIISLISLVWALTWKATEQKAREAKEDAKCAKTEAFAAKSLAERNEIRIDGIKEDVGEIKTDVKTLLKNSGNGKK